MIKVEARPGWQAVWCPRAGLNPRAWSAVATALFLWGGVPHTTAAPGDPAQRVSFVRDLAPILAARCLNCHLPGKAKGGYQVSSFSMAARAGDSGKAPWKEGDPSQGELLGRLRSTDPDDRMPQKDDPLPANQIALFEQWIREGAGFDGLDPSLGLEQLDLQHPHPASPTSYPPSFPIHSLLHSISGETLYVGGHHEIRVVEATTGKGLARIGNVPERITAMAWVDNGGWLAIAGGSPGRLGEVRLIDTKGTRPPRIPIRTTDVVLALAASPDGKWLLAGGCDGTLRILALPEIRLVKTLDQHSDWITALSFGASSDRVASASRDRSARIFAVKDWELIGAYLDSGDALRAVTVISDGARIASGGRDRKLTIWDASEAKARHTIPISGGDVTALSWVGGSLWMMEGDKSVVRYELEDSGKPVKPRVFSLPEPGISSFSIHPRTDRLVVGTKRGRLFSWTISTNQTEADLGTPFPLRSAGRSASQNPRGPATPRRSEAASR